MRIKSSGNVGIGTTNPTEKLTVAGNGKFNDNLIIGKQVSVGGSLMIDSLAGIGFQFDSLSNKSYKLIYVDQDGKLTTEINRNYQQKTGLPCSASNFSAPWELGGNVLPVTSNDNFDLNFIGTCSEYPFRIFTNASERMRITADGFVGIGAFMPRQKLEVRNGSILVSGENSGVFFHQSFNNAPSGNHGNYGIEYLPPNVINDNKGGLNFLRPDGSVCGIKNFVLHLADNGKVGIGTGNPEATFHIFHTDLAWSFGFILDVADNDINLPSKAFTIRNSQTNTELFRV